MATCSFNRRYELKTIQKLCANLEIYSCLTSVPICNHVKDCFITTVFFFKVFTGICPKLPRWYYFSKACYYVENTKKDTWDNARIACQGFKKTDLVKITNSREKVLLFVLLFSYYKFHFMRFLGTGRTVYKD